jgi:hypothetical protein
MADAISLEFREEFAAAFRIQAIDAGSAIGRDQKKLLGIRREDARNKITPCPL